ncbi:MAG: hypothetical protein JXB32_17550 [Deltaproteobacteria bacterium]|nr:hypothetical protein [Deltaproteobacteria bacterium]
MPNRQLSPVRGPLVLLLTAFACGGSGEVPDGQIDGADAVDVPEDGTAESDLDVPLDTLEADGRPDTAEAGDVEADDAGGPPVPRLAIVGDWLGVVGRDGTFRVCLPTGELPPVPVSDGLFARMAAGGRNCAYMSIGAGGYYEDSLDLYADGHFLHGWNEAYWTALEDALARATENEVGLLVGLWGTVALECDAERDARWYTNPWNADVGRGGPYDSIPPAEGCGKRAFYTFERYGETVYDPSEPYPAGASMSVRGQWRQEEIVHRLATLVSRYPIASVMLMWEAGDPGSNRCDDCGASWETIVNWHRHMADYIRSIGPGTLVSTGTFHAVVTRFVPAAGLDFIEDEGDIVPRMDGWCTYAASLGVPIVWTGYVRKDDSGGDCANRTWDGCVRAEAVENVYEWMRRMWSCGVQLSTPFWEYRYGFSPEFDPFVTSIRSYLDTIASWEDEPGSELSEASFPPRP